jgi:hypothetical protein
LISAAVISCRPYGIVIETPNARFNDTSEYLSGFAKTCQIKTSGQNNT